MKTGRLVETLSFTVDANRPGNTILCFPVMLHDASSSGPVRRIGLMYDSAKAIVRCCRMEMKLA